MSSWTKFVFYILIIYLIIWLESFLRRQDWRAQSNYSRSSITTYCEGQKGAGLGQRLADHCDKNTCLPLLKQKINLINFLEKLGPPDIWILYRMLNFRFLKLNKKNLKLIKQCDRILLSSLTIHYLYNCSPICKFCQFPCFYGEISAKMDYHDYHRFFPNWTYTWQHVF